MGVLIKRERGLVLTGIARLSVIAFIVSLGGSLIDTVWSVYIDSFVNNVALVGYISGGLTLISFLCFFLFIPLIEKFSKSMIYSIALFLLSIIYFLFAFHSKFYLFIILAILATIFTTLRITTYGIIMKDKSPRKKLARNEGLVYTFTNSAWIMGPLIAGFILGRYGFGRVFVLSALCMLSAFFLFEFFRIKDKNIKKKVDSNFFKNFINFFKDKNRILAYILGGGVNFWWSLIFLFIPLFIIKNGLGPEWIGYFLFGISVPLILCTYKFAKIAGNIGFKKIFKIGFFIPFILSFLCFFMTNIYIILGLLILASFGLAMIESTTETYFLDIIKKKDIDRFYGPYNTTIDANHFIGRILAATLLVVLPFKFLFLFFGAFMGIFFLISFKTKNVIEDGKN